MVGKAEEAALETDAEDAEDWTEGTWVGNTTGVTVAQAENNKLKTIKLREKLHCFTLLLLVKKMLGLEHG
jgi:hypothetical protein